jgi:CRP-like cAMP-binding protein
VAAGEDFCRLGQEKHEAAFIHEGIVRYYVLLPDGEDTTKDFGFADSFTVSFGSAVTGRPADVAIAAVTDCALTVWPYSQIVTLYDQHTEWQRFGRRIAELLYVRKERREMSFLQQGAAARYRVAREAFPAELERVPQRLLASYLGIRPQSLSRLKRANR